MDRGDYIWKVRCPESGYIIGECGCTYCYDEFELDAEYLDDVDVEEDYLYHEEWLADLTEEDLIEDDEWFEEVI